MSSRQVDTESQAGTYGHCAVQLNLFSLILVTLLSAVCGGLCMAAIMAVVQLLGFIEFQRFDDPVINFIMFPLLAGFFSAVFAVLGYPLYRWICKNIRGQKLGGIFHNPH